MGGGAAVFVGGGADVLVGAGAGVSVGGGGFVGATGRDVGGIGVKVDAVLVGTGVLGRVESVVRVGAIVGVGTVGMGVEDGDEVNVGTGVLLETGVLVDVGKRVAEAVIVGNSCVMEGVMVIVVVGAAMTVKILFPHKVHIR